MCLLVLARSVAIVFYASLYRCYSKCISYWLSLRRHPSNTPAPNTTYQTPPTKRLHAKHCPPFASAFSCPLTAVFDKLWRAPLMGSRKCKKSARPPVQIEPFKVEIWMNEWETRCTYNLAETCVASITVEELLALAGGSADDLSDLLSMKLTYGDIEGSPRLRKAIAGLYDKQSTEAITVTHGTIAANMLAQSHCRSRRPRGFDCANLPTTIPSQRAYKPM